MLRSFVLNKYIAKEFLKITFIITFGFFCLGIIINLFEEINFVKEKSESLYLPILLTLLIMPNLIFNFFPFIILFASIWLFLRLTKTDEIVILKQ